MCEEKEPHTYTQKRKEADNTPRRDLYISKETYICAEKPRRLMERWGAGVETQKNVRGEVGGWGRVPFNETYAPSLSTIYDGA